VLESKLQATLCNCERDRKVAPHERFPSYTKFLTFPVFIFSCNAVQLMIPDVYSIIVPDPDISLYIFYLYNCETSLQKF